MLKDDAPVIERVGFRRGARKRGNPYLPPKQINIAAHLAHRVGPHSRPIRLVKIDLRTREGAFLHDYECMLIEHLGGNPTITQLALINRTARLALHLELLDQKALNKRRALTPTDCHFYGVWANSLSRHLQKLGFKPVKPPAPRRSLDDILADSGDERPG
jgi:hypothetical protein